MTNRRKLQQAFTNSNQPPDKNGSTNNHHGTAARVLSNSNYLTPGGDINQDEQEGLDLKNTTVVAGPTPGGSQFHNIAYNKVKSTSTINVVCVWNPI